MSRFRLHMGSLTILFALGAALAQADTGVPRLVVDEPHFDFGQQQNNQTIEHTFVIRNEGDATLDITNVRSSCGCTVGNVSTRSVPPGGTSEITGLYNLRGRRGTQRSVLTVESNDPANPRAALTMGGVALQELAVRPDRVFFGQVNSGETTTREIEVFGLVDKPFEITAMRFDSEHFAARIREPSAPHHYVVDVDVRAPQQAGMIQDILQVHTTHPQFPVLHVAVNAQVAGALTYAPNNISLLAGHATPVTRYIVIRPGAVRDFEITEVVPPQDDIRVQVLNLPNQGYRIQLTNLLPSEELAGKSVRIHTSVESMSVINIPIEIIEAAR
jgi:hypothetical protein